MSFPLTHSARDVAEQKLTCDLSIIFVNWNAGALLAKGHPIGLLPSAFAFSALFVGGEAIKTIKFISVFSGEGVQVPVAIVLILQVLVIVCIIGGDYLSRYRVSWKPHG